MTNWVDKLAAHSQQQKRRERKVPVAAEPEPQVEVHEAFIQVRGASEDGDPGEIQEVFYFMKDDMLQLCNSKGAPLEGSRPEPVGAADPHQVAGRVMRVRRDERNDDFDRPIRYFDRGWR
jgi:hypothetical protein